LDLLDAFGAGIERGDIPLVDRDAGCRLELLRRRVVAAIVGRHLAAGRQQGLADRFADTACSPRHQRNTCHGLDFLPAKFRSRAPPLIFAALYLSPHFYLSTLSLSTPFYLSTFYLPPHMPFPIPPPMQSVARPFLALRFCISCNSVTSTRA